MRRSAAAPVVAAALAFALVGCQKDEEPAPPAIEEYVALGDSYTAAPLVPPTDTTNPCLRSEMNYPNQIADALRVEEFTDVSCSGASTEAITDGQPAGDSTLPPQLDAVSDSTDLVTISIGGNDYNFFLTLTGQCLRLAATDVEGSPCRDANEDRAEDPYLANIPRIKQNVLRVIEAVKERAPQAEIVVVNYPKIVPENGTCTDILPMAAGDYAYFDEVMTALSGALSDAAKAAKVPLADVYEASRGHDVCAPEPWINGMADQSRASPLHPFVSEQQAVADLVLDKL